MRALIAMVFFCVVGVCGAENSPPLPTAVKQMLVLDEKIGSGKSALADSVVLINYRGWLFDASAADRKGLLFDQALDPAHPLSFTVGHNQVIKGFDQGVTGMHVGGKRTIFIPADMGYGVAGVAGHIPPNSALIFELELLGIQ